MNKLIGKKVLYRKLKGTAYGIVEKVIDSENVGVKIKNVDTLAKVNLKDIVNFYE